MNDPNADLAFADNVSGSVANAMAPALTIIGSVLWILVASPLLVESDTYRYAAAVLALIAFFYYVRASVRPRTDWLGWLCLGWGAYVVARFAVIYLFTPKHDIGASDWLYAFPFFFPILGLAFLLYEKVMEKIVAGFFAVALIMLIATQHFRDVFAGETVRPLIMNNQIHGAVACGLIVIFALFWLLHYLTEPTANRAFARFSYVVSPLVVILCMIAIYGAKSKGVWLALSITLPLLALAALTYLRLKTGIVVVACAAVLLVASIYTVRQNLDKTAGPTVSSAIAMVESITGGHDVDGVVSNSWEVISSAPVFGWGSEWLERWQQTRYAHIQYTLLHNGYLEILIRYGLFGAAIMAIILVAFIVNVWRAYQAGIIPRAAWHAYAVAIFFFALTLLSNSNNRLAIGESFALTTSAFACWCNARLRGQTLGSPKLEQGALTAGA